MQQVFVVYPQRGADALEYSLDHFLLVIFYVAIGEQTGGAFADERRGVGHDPHHGQSAAEPLVQGIGGEAGGNGDHEGASVLNHRGNVPADVGHHLRFDRQDDHVCLLGAVAVVGGDADAEALADGLEMSVIRGADPDITGLVAVVQHAANDGAGHVAGSDK